MVCLKFILKTLGSFTDFIIHPRKIRAALNPEFTAF